MAMKEKIWLTGGFVACTIAIMYACSILLSTTHTPTSTVVHTTAQTTVITTTPSTSTTTTQQADNPRMGFSFTAEQQQQLDDMLKSYGGNVAVWYEDLHSSYTYQYNTGHAFFAASIVKAPYCMYLLQLASEGNCDLTQKIAFTEDIRADGAGIVKEQPYGTEFTVQQLIEYAICHSDNAALRMLRSIYSAEGFKEFSSSIGIKNVDAISNITGANINAEDAATYMRAIYKFINENETYGGMLHEYMSKTRNPMFTSSYTLVRKYGWATDAFHDTAIVEAPHPYILVFLTDHAEGTVDDFAMFRNLSNTVETFSNQP